MARLPCTSRLPILAQCPKTHATSKYLAIRWDSKRIHSFLSCIKIILIFDSYFSIWSNYCCNSISWVQNGRRGRIGFWPISLLWPHFYYDWSQNWYYHNAFISKDLNCHTNLNKLIFLKLFSFGVELKFDWQYRRATLR